MKEQHIAIEHQVAKLRELLTAKNNDYNNSASQTFKQFGMTAYIVRMTDKLNRITHLAHHRAEVGDEKITDTLRDLAGYCILALADLEEEAKPTQTKSKDKGKGLVYVSIPITGHDYEKQKSYAKEVAKRLEEDGYRAITPFDIVEDEGTPYQVCVGRCIEKLLESDFICLCKGWNDSHGCMLEGSVASIYNIGILKDEEL